MSQELVEFLSWFNFEIDDMVALYSRVKGKGVFYLVFSPILDMIHIRIQILVIMKLNIHRDNEIYIHYQFFDLKINLSVMPTLYVDLSFQLFLDPNLF